MYLPCTTVCLLTFSGASGSVPQPDCRLDLSFQQSVTWVNKELAGGESHGGHRWYFGRSGPLDGNGGARQSTPIKRLERLGVARKLCVVDSTEDAPVSLPPWAPLLLGPTAPCPKARSKYDRARSYRCRKCILPVSPSLLVHVRPDVASFVPIALHENM